MSENDIVQLHHTLVAYFQATTDPIDPPGVKTLGLVGSAASRPATSLGKEDKYKTIELKAAALFHSLVKNHPFHNGNKRTALVVLIAFLALNDRRIKNDVSDDEFLEMVVGVAANTFPQAGLGADAVVDGIAAWLGRRISAKRARSSTMKVSDFLDSCKKAGLQVKVDGMGHKIIGRGGIVKIPRSTRDLPGGVLRIYLQNLGMSEAETGIGIDEFQDGISDEHAILRRFQTVLTRLAHL